MGALDKAALDSEKGGFLRKVLFPDLTRGALTFFEFVIIAGGLIGTCDAIGSLAGVLNSDKAVAFRTYLWTSLIIQTVVVASVVVIFRGLGALRARDAQAKAASLALKDEVATREDGLHLLHRMAETVRCCAVANDVQTYKELFDATLGHSLCQYLAKRIHSGDKVSMTVKMIARDKSGNRELVDVFRDSEQHKTHRPMGSEKLEENYVFRSLDARNPDHSGWVMIRDVEKMDPQYRKCRDRARNRQYKSFLAFPLNRPNMDQDQGDPDSANLTPLIGFLGLDAPIVGAFDNLFTFKDTTVPVEPSNTGDDRKASEDMHLFYGLADSIATIVHLNSDPARRKAP
jgi:hypothetical protein